MMRSDSSNTLANNPTSFGNETTEEFGASLVSEYVASPDRRTSKHLSRAIFRFIQLWRHNRTEILHLAITNVLTTLVMEACVRTLISKMFNASPAYDFIVNDSLGVHINRQSLTNMWITGFTSLFGGPVLFISTRTKRYAFFVCFGLIVSILGQICAVLSVGSLGRWVGSAVLTRLLFDFAYNGSIKFLLFEIARRPLLSSPLRISFRIGSIRLCQDFSTTLFRVSLLNLLGLKG